MSKTTITTITTTEPCADCAAAVTTPFRVQPAPGASSGVEIAMGDRTIVLTDELALRVGRRITEIAEGRR